ncbi:cytochrome-c peroxidase [Hymenobacter psychrotolerans]|uniref:Cytochrome c peroxidase n=1 Tax=Hymenobacter psychrotolerans DSM 18569 TaxID=1121959 RepID=A0A1M6VUK1_9BACT|nr:cytochrome c peroxidase [Hymenobacter psychrotolerans]SHK85074.1 cytochrome c peroxidase [Hymenobacter psychrotolerans DSM 18569]
MAALLSAAACHREEPQPVEPQVPLPTPYTLEIPSQLPKGVVIPANNQLTVEGIDLGRKLFYETRLSRNNAMSCGSCHQQSKAFTDGRALAVGVDGIAHQRNTMSLVNLLWEPTLNWDGAATTLETQARTPIENPVELHQSLATGVSKLQQTDMYPPLFARAFGSSTITEENVLKALAQFQRTLISSNTRYEQSLLGQTRLNDDERAGRLLFFNHPGEGGNSNARGGSCDHCHNGNNFTFTNATFATVGGTAEFVNNGLDMTFADPGRFGITGRPSDKGLFRVPTLRNIALTAPYMHDGRFQTLEEVVDHYNEHIQRNSPNVNPILLLSNPGPAGSNSTTLNLTATEKRQLVAFLKTLTDSTFIQDKRFSNPF